ncbi:MAG: hypothetical protein ACLUL2_18860 [Blautia sp.]
MLWQVYINYSDNHLGIDKTLKKSERQDTSRDLRMADTDGIVEEIESLDYDLTDESAL